MFLFFIYYIPLKFTEEIENVDKDEWAEFATAEADDAAETIEHKLEKPAERSHIAAANYTKSKSGMIKLEANTKKPNKLFGSIKINGRGNVVVYLVRPTVSKPPGASQLPTAAKISVQKSTSIPFLAKLFNLGAAKPTPKKVSTAVRPLKATTKKKALPLAAKKSVKAINKKQAMTVTLQGKRVIIKATSKKVTAQKKTTKRATKKIIAMTTNPTLKATTSAEEEIAAVTVVVETDFEEGPTEANKVIATSSASKTTKDTTVASEVDAAALFELDESSGMLEAL